jgi:radical SAM protein with 4Fe4S-binding SPASM domain
MVLKNQFSQESLGIGLTSRCNLNCPHCYSKNLAKETLSLEMLKDVIKNFPNLKRVNFGTGESILNPEFTDIIDFFHGLKIKMALTTNGATINKLSEEYLKKLDEVDVSIDFPSAKEHDNWRGKAGLFSKAIKTIERCKRAGVEVSIAMVLMNHNYRKLKKFKKILDEYKVYLRVNLYKPINSDKYSLDYDEFWEAVKEIADNFTLVSCSEPVLSLIVPPAMNIHGSPCGDSVRLHPDLSISPCVYLDGNKFSLSEFNNLKKQTPAFCLECKFLENCRGGCLSRRILEGRVGQPDSYCPIYKGDNIPKIEFKKIKSKNFIHSNYLCTFILR